MSKISREQKHIHLRKYCLKYIIYTLLLLELKHSMKSTPRMMLTQNLKLKHWLESKSQQNVGNILQIRCKNKLKQGQHLQQSTNYTLIKLWIDKWYDRLFAINITISRETIMVFPTLTMSRHLTKLMQNSMSTHYKKINKIYVLEI